MSNIILDQNPNVGRPFEFDEITPKQAIETETKRFIRKIMANGGTQKGAEWAAACLDPFHDCELEVIMGYPDGSGNKSILQCVPQQFTMSAPASVTTGTWDAQLILYPFVQPYVATQGVYLQIQPGYQSPNGRMPFYGPCTGAFVGSSAASGQLSLGGLGWCRGVSGFTGFDPALPAADNNNVTPDPRYTVGAYRVVGQAFEVRTAGPALYKSGNSIMWRQPTPGADAADVMQFNNFVGTSIFPTQASALVQDGFPITQKAMRALPDSVSGLSSDGCYVVSRMNSPNCPIQDYGGVSPVYLMPSTYGSNVVTAASPLIGYQAIGPILTQSSTTFNGGSAFTTNVNSVVGATNFDITGCGFFGLNPQDVLVVTVKWYIQRFPSATESDLVVLRKASPVLDLAAQQAYFEAIQRLPVGCPVRLNGLGDWFRSAAAAVTKYVAPVLGTIAGPKGKAVGAAISAMNGLIAKEKKVEKKIEKVENKVAQVANQVTKVKKKKGKK
jgi:hypothetical protein